MAAVHSGAVVPVWASEVDEFPSAVTEVHFPEMAQLGDICAIDGAEFEHRGTACGSRRGTQRTFYGGDADCQ